MATKLASAEEKQNEELLLRRFKLMDDIVDKVRQDNIKAGVDEKVMKQFIPWTEFVQRKIKYKGWLEACTNPRKPGTFYDVKYLRRKEAIGEEDAVEHENKTYPYRRLDSLYRIKDKAGKQYLMRLEGWYGLDINGEEKRISVNDLDFYVKPTVRYERVPKDPEYPNGLSLRVGNILDNHGGDPAGDKTYLTSYSPEKVQEFLSYGSINTEEPSAGTTLLLQKEGHPGTPVTYEDFVSEEFDETLKRINKPDPTFKDFYKDLTSMAGKEQAKKEDPYG